MASSSYMERAKHFFEVADPRLAFVSTAELMKARDVYQASQSGSLSPNTSDAEVKRAKQLYESAFHPQTGELNFLLGRMSFQVPGNMLITGAMLSFYKTVPAVIIGQWANQSFNAIVNYVNRNASNPISNTQLAAAYMGATTAATSTALALNMMVKRSPALASGLVGRFVPFAAVASANCVNIPAMRFSEINNGIALEDAQGKALVDDQGNAIVSGSAAKKSIGLVVFSRIIMAVPGMTIPPILANILEKQGYFKRLPWLSLPFQTITCGLCLVFATPLACAIFPQRSSMMINGLEESAKAQVQKHYPTLDEVFFNKGL